MSSKVSSQMHHNLREMQDIEIGVTLLCFPLPCISSHGFRGVAGHVSLTGRRRLTLFPCHRYTLAPSCLNFAQYRYSLASHHLRLLVLVIPKGISTDALRALLTDMGVRNFRVHPEPGHPHRRAGHGCAAHAANFLVPEHLQHYVVSPTAVLACPHALQAL